jgi:hypothetical protein
LDEVNVISLIFTYSGGYVGVGVNGKAVAGCVAVGFKVAVDCTITGAYVCVGSIRLAAGWQHFPFPSPAVHLLFPSH